MKTGDGIAPGLWALNYQGVDLLDGHFKRQFDGALEYMLALPDDDILLGFRRRAGMPHPGDELGGWYSNDGSFDIYNWGEIGNTFGQWLSFLARAWRLTGDRRAFEKAERLMDEWAKTIAPDGYFFYSDAPNGPHYLYDKHLLGLLDVYEHMNLPRALAYLSRITDWAEKNLGRSRLPAGPNHLSFTGGDPAIRIMDNEWYTLSEGLYRAWLLTGEARYLDFARVWHYDHYWDALRRGDEEAMNGLHGYSHVNTLGGAAMAYRATGEKGYLETLQNAYDIMKKNQLLANGGYAPAEHMANARGSNYYAIEDEPKTFEVCCGSWAVFKTVRHLIELTGEARYGDWAEAALYNAVGAALPFKDDCQRRGKTFYYSDLRLGGGRKLYFEHSFPCCSGTYPEALAEYHNLVCYAGEDALYLSQYIPSCIRSEVRGRQVELEISGEYPYGEEILLRVRAKGRFTLMLRIPSWVNPGEAALLLNGRPADSEIAPGRWARVEADWGGDDLVALRLPMRLRLAPIHPAYPWRTALMAGPVLLAAEGKVPQVAGDYREPESVARALGGMRFEARTPSGDRVLFKPYLEFGEKEWATVYFDLT